MIAAVTYSRVVGYLLPRHVSGIRGPYKGVVFLNFFLDIVHLLLLPTIFRYDLSISRPCLISPLEFTAPDMIGNIVVLASYRPRSYL